LKKTIAQLKKQHRKIVFTNGCFDLLHLGHVELFQKAKTYGDILVVAINSDASLKRLKGPGRPLVSQENRSKVLAALEAVDFVTVFDEDTPYEVIAALLPDVLVKGGDYKLNEIVGREFVKKVVRFPIVEGNSTTALIKKIVKNYGHK
jgi:D-beta-D-heptose 7-phosphate kinase/D-beta-D-heptose 1-phosphate adenosyltransferase